MCVQSLGESGPQCGREDGDGCVSAEVAQKPTYRSQSLHCDPDEGASFVSSIEFEKRETGCS